MRRIASTFLALAALGAGLNAIASESSAPSATSGLVFDEADGIVAVEAEHFDHQTLHEKRGWHATTSGHTLNLKPDPDPAHVAGASSGSYLEVLPDTRKNHDEKLIKGENFLDEPGKMAVLHYKIHLNTPGRYYVWIRSFSTGTEDNGIHVGLNGEWPESGQRWQTVQKDRWSWACAQRTEEVQLGVPMQLFLDIENPGEHEVLFSMREDGFEMDKFVLARDKGFVPEGTGPEVKVRSGQLPAPYPEVAEAAPGSKAFPRHWGAPPAKQTRDIRPLPGGYGKGSGTLAKWIQEHLDQDAAAKFLKDRPATFAKLTAPLLVQPRQPDGNAEVAITGELKQWHKVTLTLDGPFAHERDTQVNAFTDLAFNVQFTHESGAPSYRVPGYFAADGRAGESSAESGTKWRAHLSPDKAGSWKYAISFTAGKNAALDGGGQALVPFDGVTGEFKIAETDKTGRDFRAHGRLQYVGKHHLQFAGSKQFFLKAGPDSPETLLAYMDFDCTHKAEVDRIKTWEPHVADWKPGDPTWGEGKGKGLIGALNYLSGKGVNAFSFLTYNVSGDGDNVWPFVERDTKMHYDCSKLDQWGVVFDHATALGLYLHFKLQENEMDDDRRKGQEGGIPASLDGGRHGIERKLYCREIIARFGHALALNWNMGEENTQSTEEIRDMAAFLHATDPYRHQIVLHTFPGQQDKVYGPLLGDQSHLTGVSLQNSWRQVNEVTLEWLQHSAAAGRPWVVANDEQNPAGLGVPPDPGYQGHDGLAVEKQLKGSKEEGNFKGAPYTMHDIRKLTLWGNLMAGGAGVEYYFGYSLPENDLACEDFRSRDQSWDFCRIALNFFRDEEIPFASMASANALIGNEKDDNSRFCFAKPGEIYLVYLPEGGSCQLDLREAEGGYRLAWFNPRVGGPLQPGHQGISGGEMIQINAPDQQDWLAVLRKP